MKTECSKLNSRIKCFLHVTIDRIESGYSYKEIQDIPVCQYAQHDEVIDPLNQNAVSYVHKRWILLIQLEYIPIHHPNKCRE